MKYFLFILISIIYTASETISGSVSKVIDGDTIIILMQGNIQERIRLADIDAPETGQDFSEKSRLYLSALIAGKTVEIEYKERDMYGRILGTVYVDGINVNEEMVKSGLAWNYYYSRNKRMAELEAQAKNEKKNIFSVPNPIQPYDYRRGKR